MSETQIEGSGSAAVNDDGAGIVRSTMSQAARSFFQEIGRDSAAARNDAEDSAHYGGTDIIALAGPPAQRKEPGTRYGAGDLVLLAFAEVVVEG